MSEGELWRDVVGFEGLYQVSNKGNVYSVERISLQGIKIGGVTLRPRVRKDGYLQIILYKNGKPETKQVHRLVAEAFIPNQNNYPEINHMDENPSNNHVENLEWCTREYNNNYGTRTERTTQTKSKKVKAVNVKTGEVITFNSTNEAERKGYHSGNVSSACRGIYRCGNTGKLIGGDGRTYRGHRWYYI